MNFPDTLVRFQRDLASVDDQADAVELARQALKSVVPEGSLVHLTPVGATQTVSGEVRSFSPSQMELWNGPRRLPHFCLNRDFTVWLPHSSHDDRLVDWMEQLCEQLNLAMRTLPAFQPTSLLPEQQRIELKLQEALQRAGQVQLGCLKIQGYQEVAGLLGPGVANRLMASFLESLKSQPSRSVWARYRADRLLVLSKESGELHTLSSEFEATGTNCELPLRLATSEILALAAQGSALDWIPS